ncbi:MAG: riboflavin synthase, partial [Leptolyngbyaceae cyanobacterium CSU_1_3]|nr:riboflavin synthase [Leptolyngbyaceae cyanobacterium CSU_1_3]
MFTGLIQTVGTLHAIGVEHLQINCPEQTAGLILEGLAIGDSVAVDGVCLTVTEILSSGFVAVVSPETQIRTTLSQTEGGTKQVNLETSLKVGSKLGGHFVTGHVDGVGRVMAIETEPDAWTFTFRSAPYRRSIDCDKG